VVGISLDAANAPERDLELERLQRTSLRLARLATTLAILLPLAGAWTWFSADPSVLVARASLSPLTAPSGLALGIAGLISLVPALLLSRALLSARRAFLLVARGAFLMLANADALRAFGRYVLLAALAGLLAPTLIGLVLSAGNPPGARSLVLSLDSTSLVGLLFGATLWTVAGLMARAAILADEHEQIV
jgi:hypothetical protein